MHHPPFPAFAHLDRGSDAAGPYAVALIELAEGVRMVSNVIGVPHDKVRIGMPVRLEFLRVDEELELPVFRAERARAEWTSHPRRSSGRRARWPREIFADLSTPERLAALGQRPPTPDCGRP